jgi:hypothetical protein
VCGHLGAGVAGADDHERGPRGALGRVVGGVGHFDLLVDVIAEVQRLRHTAESMGVLATPGTGSSLLTLPADSTSRS